MKLKNRVLLFVCILLSCFSIKAQQGKDGAANITATSTVNIYTPLIANAAAGATSITVASTAGLSAGDLILIIQMQGATIIDSVNQYGNPNSDVVGDTSFGKIRAYNGAGNNEFAEITSISGNMITIDCGLKNSYSDTIYPHPGNAQIIRVPRYTSLTLSGAGLITCPSWDGHTGGVVVIEVQGNTSIGSGTSINVAGKGFRGGSVLNATAASVINTGNSFGTSTTSDGAHKGESIAGDTNVYKNHHNYNANGYSLSTPLATCKGNVANGGGGGNGNNCGGGGGSNGGVISTWNGMGNADVSTANNIAAWNQESTTPLNGSFRPTTSSGGGRGGYAYSVNNADPTSAGNGPNSIPVWGSGDGRHNDGGWGGTPLDYSNGRIFLGGGGGAGDSNDGNGTSGGNGGGIVYLLSYGTVTGAGQIIADGAKALNTNWVASTFDEALAQGDDGAGGGGGGGAVFINSTGNITLTNTLSISAQGGVGGNYFMHNTVNNHNFGPGGGGGGGYVAATNTVSGVNVNGGANGIVAGAALGSSNASRIATKFPPNGATAGGAGSIATTLTPNFYLTATNYTTCSSSALSLSVTVNGTAPSGLSVNWYTVAAGGTSVFTGNPYAITAPATAGTYTYYAGTCPGTYRVPIIVTVTSASGPVLNISATKTVTCSGSNDTLSVSGATSYTWSANAGSVSTNTAIVAPITNTTYTVTGTSTGACAGTSTASISITVNTAPSITITPTSNTLCSGSSDVLTATSTATSYTWSTNAGSATTNTVSITPLSTDTYTVTGINGVCSATQTIAINVTATPTVSIAASNTVICNGSSATFTASGATTYSWSTGAITNTVSVSPISNTSYTVTGYNGSCSTTQTIAINVNPTPTVNIAASNTAICNGSNTTFTVSGATTYSWMPGTGLSSTTNSVVVANPTVTTTYTVIGTSATCTGTNTIMLTVNPTPTVMASSSAVCGGDSASLTANGAVTYTWSPSTGLSTTTGSVVMASPPSTTVYNITGTDANGCTATAASTVTIGTPVITVNSATLCAGNTSTLTANGATTYTWSPSIGLSSTNGSTVTATPSVTTTYTVTGNVGTCTATPGTTTVTVISPPSITVTATSNTICLGSPDTLTATGATTYSWSANAGSATTNTVLVYPAGNPTYTVIGNNGSCATTQTIVIHIVPAVTFALTTSSPDTVCLGASVTFSVTGAPSNTYTWSTSAGGGNGTVVTVTPSAFTNYSVTGSNGVCSATAAYPINVYSIQSISVTPNQPTICSGASTTLTATGANTYTWTPATGLSFPSNSVAVANPTVTTTYIVSGSVGSCSAIPTTATVVVNSPPTITITTSPTIICSGNSSTLTATGANTYTWTPVTGLSFTSNSVAVANPTVTTTYIVSGSVGSCSAISGTTTLNVNPLPSVNVTPTATVCAGGSSASATLIATGNATSYSWTPATGLSATSGSMVTANPSVPMLYTVTGTDANNCHSQAVSIVATSTLQASFIPTPDAGNAPLNVQFTNTSNGGTNYVWIYGNGLNQNTINLTDTSGTVYNTPGTYTVTLTASNVFGCTDTYTTTISVLQSYSITIPNIFSPNGDNINDNFEVKATGITSLNCDIYDRWGLKLYTFSGASGYWDGTAKGGKEVDGTYFYVIQATDIKGDSHKYNGFIELIR